MQLNKNHNTLMESVINCLGLNPHKDDFFNLNSLTEQCKTEIQKLSSEMNYLKNMIENFQDVATQKIELKANIK
jgi:hypothetical protein